MTTNAPTPKQVKRLASLIAAKDLRGDGTASAERYHQASIEKNALTGAELDMLSDLIENAVDTYEEHPESMLISRYIAEALSVDNLHFLFVISRCYQSIADIANHFSGNYKDYPVITVADLFNHNLKPKKKWGVGHQRLHEADYDRMASILVALYLNRSLELDGSCMLRIDLYSKVIEPLVIHEAVIRRSLPGLLTVIDEAKRAMMTSQFGFPARVELDVHELIRLAELLDGDERNVARALAFVHERKNLNISALEALIKNAPAPALIGGGL